MLAKTDPNWFFFFFLFSSFFFLLSLSQLEETDEHFRAKSSFFEEQLSFAKHFVKNWWSKPLRC